MLDFEAPILGYVGGWSTWGLLFAHGFLRLVYNLLNIGLILSKTSCMHAACIYMCDRRVCSRLGTIRVPRFSPIRPGQWWSSWALASAPDGEKCWGTLIDLSVRMGSQAPSAYQILNSQHHHRTRCQVMYVYFNLKGKWGQSGWGTFRNRGRATSFLDFRTGDVWSFFPLECGFGEVAYSLKFSNTLDTTFFPNLDCSGHVMPRGQTAFAKLGILPTAGALSDWWWLEYIFDFWKASEGILQTIRWDHVSCSQGPSNLGSTCHPCSPFQAQPRPPRTLSSHEGLCRQAQPGSPENDCHETSLGDLSPFHCRSVTKLV